MKSIVSFSGGRSSGLMVIKLAEQGVLEDKHIIFSDTGREHPECYEFVDKVEEFVGQPIHRLERPGKFDAMLVERPWLPNSAFRFCTTRLKLEPLAKFMVELGGDDFTNIIGFRADEPNRVAKKRGVVTTFTYHPKHKKQIRFDWEKVEKQKNHAQFKFIDFGYEFPLYERGISKQDVASFWKRMPFDLMSPLGGDSNCVFCPMKGFAQKVELARECPEIAKVWLEDEKKYKGTYSKEYSMIDVIEFASRQTSFFDPALVGDSVNCECTD